MQIISFSWCHLMLFAANVCVLKELCRWTDPNDVTWKPRIVCGVLRLRRVKWKSCKCKWLSVGFFRWHSKSSAILGFILFSVFFSYFFYCAIYIGLAKKKKKLKYTKHTFKYKAKFVGQIYLYNFLLIIWMVEKLLSCKKKIKIWHYDVKIGKLSYRSCLFEI